jgi:hypothetical protein
LKKYMVYSFRIVSGLDLISTQGNSGRSPVSARGI